MRLLRSDHAILGRPGDTSPVIIGAGPWAEARRLWPLGAAALCHDDKRDFQGSWFDDYYADALATDSELLLAICGDRISESELFGLVGCDVMVHRFECWWPAASALATAVVSSGGSIVHSSAAAILQSEGPR